jgi:hypothetical protein
LQPVNSGIPEGWEALFHMWHPLWSTVTNLVISHNEARTGLG